MPHSLTHSHSRSILILARSRNRRPRRAAPRRGPTAKFRRAKNRDLRTLNERTNERTNQGVIFGSSNRMAAARSAAAELMDAPRNDRRKAPLPMPQPPRRSGAGIEGRQLRRHPSLVSWAGAPSSHIIAPQSVVRRRSRNRTPSMNERVNVAARLESLPRRGLSRQSRLFAGQKRYPTPNY